MQVNKKHASIERSNPLTVSFRASDETATIEKYEQELRPKPYFKAARIEFITASFLSYLANVVSILTAFSFLLFNLVSILPEIFPTEVSFAVGGVLSGGLLVALEATKRSNTSAFFKSRLINKQTSSRAALFLFFMAVLSVGFSAMGAAELAKLATDESKVLTEQREQELDDVRKDHAIRVQSIQGEIEELESDVKEKIRKRQLLTMPEAVATTIQGKRNEIEAIRQAQEREEKAVIDSFASLMTNNSQDTRSALYFMVGVSLVAELLAVLCLWFAVYYKYRVVLESKADTRSASNEVEDKHPPHERTTEGGNKDECLQCGKEYAKRAPHQKFCSKDCRISFHEKKNGKDLSRFRVSCFLPLLFVPAKVLFILACIGVLYCAGWLLAKKLSKLLTEFRKENRRLENHARRLKKEANKYKL